MFSILWHYSRRRFVSCNISRDKGYYCFKGKRMSRRIITRQLQSQDASQRIDTYSDKILKNIPDEIVAAWIAASNLIKSATDVPRNIILWIAFIIGIILTIFWTKKQTDIKGLP